MSEEEYIAGISPFPKDGPITCYYTGLRFGDNWSEEAKELGCLLFPEAFMYINRKEDDTTGA